jgi:hypothetical protein
MLIGTAVLVAIAFGVQVYVEYSRPPEQVATTATTTPQREGNPPSQTPLPKFRMFKFKTDVPTSYVVPVKTSDEELKSLLWFFRQSVRAGDFKKIGITQPTATRWGKLGYTSGMLVVFRGEKCANEDYISDAQIAKGELGPCGYGEHDDGYYQWGIDGDSVKDTGGIIAKNGDLTKVFDYEDNWHPSSEVPQVIDQKVKEEWKVRQEEWEPRQRFAVQVTNQLTKKGINVHASANVNQPKQMDFRSQLFRNTAFRDTFINNALPQIHRDLCNIGFQSIRILQESESDAGQSYPLRCQ